MFSSVKSELNQDLIKNVEFWAKRTIFVIRPEYFRYLTVSEPYTKQLKHYCRDAVFKKTKTNFLKGEC